MRPLESTLSFFPKGFGMGYCILVKHLVISRFGEALPNEYSSGEIEHIESTKIDFTKYLVSTG